MLLNTSFQTFHYYPILAAGDKHNNIANWIHSLSHFSGNLLAEYEASELINFPPPSIDYRGPALCFFFKKKKILLLLRKIRAVL